MKICFESLQFVLVTLDRFKTAEVGRKPACNSVVPWFCVPEVGWYRVDGEVGDGNAVVKVHSTRARGIFCERFWPVGNVLED